MLTVVLLVTFEDEGDEFGETGDASGGGQNGEGAAELVDVTVVVVELSFGGLQHLCRLYLFPLPEKSSLDGDGIH